MTLPVRRGRDKAEPTSGFDPVKELDHLHKELAAYLDSWRGLPDLFSGAFTPLADVEETADAYRVEIELPGIHRDDVDIEVTGRRLTVRGERKERHRVGFLRKRERTVGQFHYEVTLPGDLDEDAVQAHLDQGVLTVELPKPARERARRIEIH